MGQSIPLGTQLGVGMGERAAVIALAWGPERFARGAVEALQIGDVFEQLRGRRAIRRERMHLATEVRPS